MSDHWKWASFQHDREWVEFMGDQQFIWSAAGIVEEALPERGCVIQIIAINIRFRLDVHVCVSQNKIA